MRCRACAQRGYRPYPLRGRELRSRVVRRLANGTNAPQDGFASKSSSLRRRLANPKGSRSLKDKGRRVAPSRPSFGRAAPEGGSATLAIVVCGTSSGSSSRRFDVLRTARPSIAAKNLRFAQSFDGTERRICAIVCGADWEGKAFRNASQSSEGRTICAYALPTASLANPRSGLAD